LAAGKKVQDGASLMKNHAQNLREAVRILEAWKTTRITFGEGSLERVGEIIRKFADRVLVVIGQSSLRSSGTLNRITHRLEKEGITYRVCEGVEPNPSMETVYRVTYHLLAGGFPCLLAVGGGSVIDAAKAGGILGTIREGELDGYFGVGMASKRINRIMPLIAVPTTSGTGSEVTKFSVITDRRLHVKKLIFDEAIVAHAAIVDPELTYGCNRHVSLVSGLDTMTHLIEGYLNTADEGIDPQANERALLGLRLLFDGLPRVVENGNDTEARKLMSAASTLGGTVLFYKQAGAPHLNSFSWSDVMDHGEACAVMLPYYTAYYAPTVVEKLRRLAVIFGVDDTSDLARTFPQALLKFYERLGFPRTLKEFKRFSEDLIDKAIRDACQNKMKLEAMPRPVTGERTEEVLRTIIQGAYEGTMDEILRL
jgi:alcohol dehydrogenase class IV